MNFNYQKAYCTQAVPAFEALPHHVKDAHSKVRALIGDLNQNRVPAIPMTEAIRAHLEELSTPELAELARASYFVGHWHPDVLPRLWENSKGESWKVTNCADQILRERLAPLPHCTQVHEGKLRVTFSSKHCWLWKEFGLATEENLALFKECNLPFCESTLDKSAAKLQKLTGDLWPDVDTVPENELYCAYLALQKEAVKQQIKKSFADKIKKLEQDRLDAQKEIEFLLLCNERDIPTNNVIYYHHTGTFCFGWHDELSETEKAQTLGKLGDMVKTYKVEFKTR